MMVALTFTANASAAGIRWLDTTSKKCKEQNGGKLVRQSCQCWSVASCKICNGTVKLITIYVTFWHTGISIVFPHTAG